MRRVRGSLTNQRASTTRTNRNCCGENDSNAQESQIREMCTGHDGRSETRRTEEANQRYGECHGGKKLYQRRGIRECTFRLAAKLTIPIPVRVAGEADRQVRELRHETLK